jgi:replicative DNA helicase
MKPTKKLEVEGKLLPHSEDIEQKVLGAIILEGSLMDVLSKDFSVNLFYDPKHRAIAKTMVEMYKESMPIDLITLIKKLQEKELVQNAGGIKYISSLSTGVSSTYNIDYYTKILQEEALRRNVILISNKAIQSSFDDTNDIFDVFSNVQHQLDDAVKSVVNYEIKTVGQVHSEVISQSIQILKSGQKSGVPSGLRLLDNVTNGWQKTDLIILAGRPGAGKTSAVVSMALFPAVNMNIPLAIFSLEMSSEQLVSRMQSQYSKINVSKLVKKQLTEDEIVHIERTTEQFKKAPMYIDDTPNISLMELKGKVRKLVRDNGVKLVIVDYLQLMRSGLKTQSREQEISEISRGLKGLAKEVNVPVIALSQLSRSVEQRGGDKKPMLSDLRESGAIEQDADMVIFCHRPEYYGFEEYEAGGQIFNSQGLFMLIVAKHRNGEIGEIPLRFIHEQTKVTNYDEIFSTFEQSNDQQEVSLTNLKPNLEFSTDLSPINFGEDESINPIEDEPPF